MRNKPRDLIGDQVFSKTIRGYSTAVYILLLFSTPAEALLRRDFGERYYTWNNYLGGLVAMIILNMIRSILTAISNLVVIFGTPAEVPAGDHLMWKIIELYIVVGLIHFVTIWVREVSGFWKHSYESGDSWLTGIGAIIIGFFNKLLGAFVHMLAMFLPEQYRAKLLGALPLMRDVRTFTERFVEPAFMLFLAFIALAFGEKTVSFWLVISFASLNLSTGFRHQLERGRLLDFRDARIDARTIRDIELGNQTKGAVRMQHNIAEMVKEVEKNPELIETLQLEQPTYARAIQAVMAQQNRKTVQPEQI